MSVHRTNTKYNIFETVTLRWLLNVQCTSVVKLSATASYDLCVYIHVVARSNSCRNVVL